MKWIKYNKKSAAIWFIILCAALYSANWIYKECTNITCRPEHVKIVTDAILFSVMFGLYYRLRSKYAKMTNLQAIVSVERSLAQLYGENSNSSKKGTNTEHENPFRFHGITNQSIKKAGLSGQELAYLVASFTAGRIYDMSHDLINRELFHEGHYRYKMLCQPDTQKAWPLIKKMMTHDAYIEKIERTNTHIIRNNPKLQVQLVLAYQPEDECPELEKQIEPFLDALCTGTATTRKELMAQLDITNKKDVEKLFEIVTMAIHRNEKVPPLRDGGWYEGSPNRHQVNDKFKAEWHASRGLCPNEPGR